jgi:uncharacterized protein (TIGR00255 family)
MLSMTGFGAGRAEGDQLAVLVQIASVNHRGCQIHIRGDMRDLALDELVRQEVRTRLMRGSITVQVQLASNRALALDRERLARSWRELAALAAELGAGPPALELVAQLSMSSAAGAPGPDEQTVRAALEQAIGAIESERRREGEALGRHLSALATQLRALMPRIGRTSGERLARVREAMRARLQAVLAEVAEVTAEQLVREVALQADRLDISEEVVRLGAHLDALEALLHDQGEAVGRKIEFLLQEVGREINTIGAKSNDAALTALVLEGKAVVEQMREQAANVA